MSDATDDEPALVPSDGVAESVEEEFAVPDLPPWDPELQAWAQKNVYAIRMGMFLLAVDMHGEKLESIHARLGDALKADSRVSDFTRPEFDPNWSFAYSLVPPLQATTVHAVLRDDDSFKVARFEIPFIFKVVVAVNNQPTFKGWKDIPTDTYFVAWDGLMVTFLWQQAIRKRISHAAGRIVADILHGAAERIGGEIRVQACSPNCENLFTHTDALLVGSGDHPVENPSLAIFELTTLRPPHEEVAIWHKRCASSFLYFARMKASARRILDLDTISRRGLTASFLIRQDREHLRSLPWRSRIVISFKKRKWKAEISSILSDLWLAVVHVESYRKHWRQELRSFTETSERFDVTKLFERDTGDDFASVNAVDMSLVRSALDSSASRLDARALTAATALAAGSGVAGAAIGSLVTVALHA